MIGFLTILIALVCILLMGVILIQNPKGGGLDSTFGGASGANQLLGAAKSTDFIEKLTWGLAATLLVLCLVATLIVSSATGGGGQGPGSMSDDGTSYIEDAKETQDDCETYYI